MAASQLLFISAFRVELSFQLQPSKMLTEIIIVVVLLFLLLQYLTQRRPPNFPPGKHEMGLRARSRLSVFNYEFYNTITRM